MSSWSKFLAEQGICTPGYGGNMPCDNGAICTRCYADYIVNAYDKWKAERG